MIKNINGKITKDMIDKGKSKRLPPKLYQRTLLILQALSDVTTFQDLKYICQPPTLRIHKLKGALKDFWSITIEKPYCIIFKYQKGVFIDVEIINYHH